MNDRVVIGFVELDYRSCSLVSSWRGVVRSPIEFVKGWGINCDVSDGNNGYSVDVAKGISAYARHAVSHPQWGPAIRLLDANGDEVVKGCAGCTKIS